LSGALTLQTTVAGSYIGVAIDPTSRFLYANAYQNGAARTFTLTTSSGAISQLSSINPE
jgi:hypothetical protein